MPPLRASLLGVRGLPRPIAPQALMVSRSASGGHRRRRLTPGRSDPTTPANGELRERN